MGLFFKMNDSNNKRFGKVFKVKTQTDVGKTLGHIDITTYESAGLDFRYSITSGETFQYNNYNSVGIKIRGILTLATATPLDWESLIDSKVVLQNGSYGIISSVNRMRGTMYNATNVIGISNNYEYTIRIS